MQSNKPRDPLLIPTELTIDAPAGVTVKEIVFPPSTDLKQVGLDQPLAVFERSSPSACSSTSRRASRRSTSRAAAPALPGLRRESTAIAPTTADAEWTLTVVAGQARAGTGDAATRTIFDTIAFGNRRGAGAAIDGSPAAPRPSGSAGAASPASRTRSTTSPIARHDRRLSGRRRVPDVHPQRRERREGARPVRRPRTAGDPADRASSAASR